MYPSTVACRQVADDSVARVQGACYWRQPRWTATPTQQQHSKSQGGVEVAGPQTWFLSTTKTSENLTHPKLRVLGQYVRKPDKYPEMHYFSCGKQANSKDFLQNRRTYDVQFIFWLLIVLLVYCLLFLLHFLLSFFSFIFLFFCHFTTSVVYFYFIPPLYSFHYFNLRLLFHLLEDLLILRLSILHKPTLRRS